MVSVFNVFISVKNKCKNNGGIFGNYFISILFTLNGIQEISEIYHIMGK